VAFPFRFGVEHDTKDQALFAFDHSGEWLLTATGNGMLHAWKTDGSTSEVWPRGLVRGDVLSQVQAVLGVTGGFVVAGVLDGALTAFHYDLRQHLCRSATLLNKEEIRSSPSSWVVHWRYDRELHSVVLHETGPRAAWDLAEDQPIKVGGQHQSLRATKALLKAVQHPNQPPFLEVSSTPPHSTEHGWVDLDEGQGTVEVFLPDMGRVKFTPREDGRPVLQGWSIVRAQCSVWTLLLAVIPLRDPNKEIRLRVYRLPDGVPLGDYCQARDRWAHVLSDDGRLLARQVNPVQVEVRPLVESAGRWFTTGRGGFHSAPLVLLGERWLLIQIDGRISHFVRWDQGVLVHLVQKQGNFQTLLQHQLRGTGLALVGVRAEQRRVPSWCAYDPRRFQRACWSNLVLVVDHFGQVFLYNHIGRLIAAFFAFQDQLAAWLPDGTCHGPQTLLSSRPTPNAPEIIGRALLDAWYAGEGTIT
jgi:hypothetical protein